MVAIGIAVAAVAAFVVSSVYYAAVTPWERRVLGERALDRGRPAAWQVLTELVRTAVVASVYAWLAGEADRLSVGPGVVLAVLLWVGFPAVLLTGSVLWERTPVVTASIHAGDWLLKLLLVAVLVGLLH